MCELEMVVTGSEQRHTYVVLNGNVSSGTKS